MSLYFAYGSNLNKEQMKRRCPKATPLKAIALNGYRLVFKYFADIDPDVSHIVHGGLWNITDDCEKKLDIYEGVSKGLYVKKYFKYDGEKVLFYKMNDTEIFPPFQEYVKCIYKGYHDFGLPTNFLFEAVKESL